MKRLALFLDGTWNTVDSATNVSRLGDLVADSDGATQQLTLYDAGVGTGRFDWLRGGALGYGLSKNVTEAYAWLQKCYDDGDEIYIFGFSRGAYTARSVAGFIAKCGLLRRGTPLGVAKLYERYQLSQTTRPIYTLDYAVSQGEVLTGAEADVLRHSRRVPIKMIAVWDSVGALGIPFGGIPGLSRSKFQFHHTRLSNLYEHAYHALAIDEHREAFQPTLWTRFTPKVSDPETGAPKREPIVEQRWFVGAHADVGGGCPGRLHQPALAWLQDKARGAGLAMVNDITPAASAHLDPVSDSYAQFMWGLYRFAKLNKRYHRTIQAPRVEKLMGYVDTVNETIDSSVFERFRADPSYRPPGLMRWAETRGADPGDLHGVIAAATGRAAVS